MPVYVDSARNRYGRMKMSHMVADTLHELHDMADRIGLKREWFQPKSSPHYDVCQAYRERAIAAGAIVINRRQLVTLRRQWREFEAWSRADDVGTCGHNVPWDENCGKCEPYL